MKIQSLSLVLISGSNYECSTRPNNISYISGAIECSIINTKAVDVLEGTMIAFDNRKIKYM